MKQEDNSIRRISRVALAYHLRARHLWLVLVNDSKSAKWLRIVPFSHHLPPRNNGSTLPTEDCSCAMQLTCFTAKQHAQTDILTCLGRKSSVIDNINDDSAIFMCLRTVWQWASIHPETEAAKMNSLIVHYIIYTCAFPTVTSQHVFCERGLFQSMKGHVQHDTTSWAPLVRLLLSCFKNVLILMCALGTMQTVKTEGTIRYVFPQQQWMASQTHIYKCYETNFFCDHLFKLICKHVSVHE